MNILYITICVRQITYKIEISAMNCVPTFLLHQTKLLTHSFQFQSAYNH